LRNRVQAIEIKVVGVFEMSDKQSQQRRGRGADGTVAAVAERTAVEEKNTARAVDNRRVLERILWILRSSARWQECRRNIRRRTIGWLGNSRRLVVRYDRSLKIYGAFFHIASFMIVLRRVVQ
jgi:transposase